MKKKKIPESVITKIHESIGAASMCWGEMPKGVFDDELASKTAKELCDEIEKKMVPKYASKDLFFDWGYFLKWSLIGLLKFSPLYFSTSFAIYFFLQFLYPLSYVQCFAIFALLRIGRIVLSKPKKATP